MAPTLGSAWFITLKSRSHARAVVELKNLLPNSTIDLRKCLVKIGVQNYSAPS